MSEPVKEHKESARTGGMESEEKGSLSAAPPAFQLKADTPAGNVMQRQEAPANRDGLGGLPAEWLEHLRLREGDRADVYIDSEGYPTAGVGHLLSAAERRQYPVGSIVPQAVRDNWLAQDARGAYNAAVAQAGQLPASNQNLINALASVNFQLGTAWNQEHRRTWAFMVAGQWENAATEAQDSTWFTQTPVRVRDFQAALRAMAGTGAGAPAAVNGNGNTRPVANGTVTGDDVNVRSGPGRNHGAVGQMDSGATVQVFETQNGWVRIGQGRWMNAEFVRQTPITNTPDTTRPNPPATSGPINRPPVGGSTNAPANGNTPATTAPIGTGVITGDDVNVRTGPGTNNPTVGAQLDKGAQVSIFERRDGWVKIGNGRWVSAQFVRANTAAAPIARGTVNADNVNVRSGPGTSHEVVGNQMDRGAAVSIFERRDGWVRIGEGRWMSAQYVTVQGNTSGGSGTTTTAPTTGGNTGSVNRPPVGGNTNAPANDSTTGSAPVTNRAEVSISQSVGQGGRNQREDVIKIQQLLSSLGFRISVTGSVGKNTIGAIASFQEAKGISSDGRVDPGGGTLRQMNATPNNAFDNTAVNLRDDDDAPRLTHSKWTNKAHLTTDTAGEVIPRQFYSNMRELIQNMNVIADNLRGTFEVGSGYRSPYYNSTLEGSASQSNHQFGRAVDIYASAYTPTQLRNELRRLIREGKIHNGGIGLYSWGCHYDIDSAREW